MMDDYGDRVVLGFVMTTIAGASGTYGTSTKLCVTSVCVCVCVCVRVQVWPRQWAARCPSASPSTTARSVLAMNLHTPRECVTVRMCGCVANRCLPCACLCLRGSCSTSRSGKYSKRASYTPTHTHTERERERGRERQSGYHLPVCAMCRAVLCVAKDEFAESVSDEGQAYAYATVCFFAGKHTHTHTHCTTHTRRDHPHIQTQYRHTHTHTHRYPCGDSARLHPARDVQSKFPHSPTPHTHRGHQHAYTQPKKSEVMLVFVCG